MECSPEKIQRGEKHDEGERAKSDLHRRILVCTLHFRVIPLRQETCLYIQLQVTVDC